MDIDEHRLIGLAGQLDRKKALYTGARKNKFRGKKWPWS